MLLLAFLFIVSATSSDVALNVFDTTNAITFEPETTSGDGSLFGYSLALTKDKLYVGAPAHNVQGAVFQCDLDGQIKEQQQGGNITFRQSVNELQVTKLVS